MALNVSIRGKMDWGKYRFSIVSVIRGQSIQGNRVVRNSLERSLSLENVPADEAIEYHGNQNEEPNELAKVYESDRHHRRLKTTTPTKNPEQSHLVDVANGVTVLYTRHKALIS